MPLLSLEWTPEGVRHGGPFPSTPMPLEPGPALDADIALYRKLSKQVGLPPSSLMLLSGSRRAGRIFLRRAKDNDDWKDFMEVFYGRYPKMRLKMAAARAAVSAMPCGYPGRSTPVIPEIVLGWEMLRAFGSAFRIVREEPLSGTSARRCDFSLYDAGGRCRVRVEVAGMLDRLGRPRTLNGLKYMARQPGRARAYELAKIPPPVIVYAGELFGVGRRRQIVARILRVAAA